MLDLEGIADIYAAREASRGCEYCSAEGLATIFHEDYDGTCPYVTEPDPRGYPRRRLTRTVAYCVCTVGRWVMFEHQKHSKDLFARINDLHHIIDSRRSGCLWSTVDPNARERPDSPKSARDLISPGTLAALAAQSIIRVRPIDPGDQDLARREMGIEPPREDAA